MNAQSPGQAVVAPVRHQVVVNAPVERAFSVFTEGFGTWWPKAHTISPVPVERAIMEPRAGGRCYDRATDGSECDWGQVLVWEPPARLVLAWQVDGTWSYEPDVEHASRVTVTFTPVGDRTEVTLVHDEFERHRNAGPELAAGVRDGWGGALQAYAAATEAAPATTAPATTAPATAAPATAAEPGFLFMVFHYPTPENRDALARGMAEMAAYLTDQPGLLEVSPPWWDEQHQSLVGISRWESQAAFSRAIQTPPADRADTHVPDGELRPRQRFYFTYPVPGRSRRAPR
jgi:uncharacterized protein YndB with AHSA1/START domain/quinol monooxygenase YgiN